MPVLDGIAATPRSSAEGLADTGAGAHDVRPRRPRYRRAPPGAAGFLLKSTPSDRLVDGVRGGRRRGGPAVAVADPATDRATRRPARPRRSRPCVARLTAREREVLHLIARGHSNPEIATELYVAGHGEVPRQPTVRQAAAAEPRPGGGARLRVRARGARAVGARPSADSYAKADARGQRSQPWDEETQHPALPALGKAYPLRRSWEGGSCASMGGTSAGFDAILRDWAGSNPSIPPCRATRV